jgi:hypothetical protein
MVKQSNEANMKKLFMAVSMFLMSAQGFSAESITLVLGPIKRSIPISELRHLEKTGKAIGLSADLLKLAKFEPKKLQEILKMKFEIDLIEVSDFLYSSLAVGILTKIGHAVHPAYSDKYSVQAFRSAFIASATDNMIEVLEIFDNYPTREMWVDLEVLPKVLDELGGYIEQLKVSQN